MTIARSLVIISTTRGKKTAALRGIVDTMMRAKKDVLKLPTGEKVDLIYLAKWPDLDEFGYLNAIRWKFIEEDSTGALAYKGIVSFAATTLAMAVRDAALEIDAIVSPRSSRTDAEPYRARIQLLLLTRDLSPGFTRKNKTRAGEATNLAAVQEEIDYSPQDGEDEIKSLLIVDDSVASGRTVAVMLEKLRAAGLPKSCQITVAAPAWIPVNE
jgi:phosphoribosylpyrophosphate synthetase